MTAETFQIEVLPVKHKLFRFANRLLCNTENAEDIVQETFLRLWSKRDNLKEYKSIEAFAMTITKNLCLDKLKSKKHKSDELTERNQGTTMDTPYKYTERADTFNKVKEIIDSLPGQQRMIIHLRDVEGYEFEEIADVLEMSVNTIRVNLSRARKKTREKMLKAYNYEFAKN
ncbi:MAG: sigma-70 family RNA polymerase sigma factor [Chlorobi bacterium]|nr:sigma-70 family RNA polymerase sigma factor [Chlorobiota bacterium]